MLEARADHVDRAEEAREALVGRVLVQLRRSGLLDDPPVAQDGDRVGQRQRLLLVVGDEHRRHALLSQQRVDLLAHAAAQRRVQRGERLVQQQRLRTSGQRAGERHALLLAAGELVRQAPCQRRDPDHLQQPGDPLAAALAAREPEADVVLDAQMGEQGAFLGHVADAALLGREVRAPVVERLRAEGDRAPLGALEAGDHAQQRRLAAAGEAEHGRQRPRLHVQLDALEHRRAAVALPHAADRQTAHAARSVFASVLMRRLSR